MFIYEIEMIDENDGPHLPCMFTPTESPNQVSLFYAQTSDIYFFHSINIYWVHTVSQETQVPEIQQDWLG